MSTATRSPAASRAGSLRILSAIADKRAGRQLAGEEIAGIVADFVSGDLPDYQMAAWLATVACQGMDLDEITALTGAYAAGGGALDLRDVGRPVVDKHSTGGVGDKVSLVVVPVVAACGVAVAKMSGRGLGHAGGTVDKLASIPGLRLDIAAAEVQTLLREVGMVITGQSGDLAPGDRATYALRDVTGTVESIPLIAASIVSKKVAVGAQGLVLDVKTGSGALIADPVLARVLCETMAAVAARFGLRCRAVLSDMSQPLGHAVGNALEVKEALAALRGEHVPHLTDLCRVVARLMLRSGEPALSDADADARISSALSSGAAHDLFVRWAGAQGGDASVLEHPERLPTAPRTTSVSADRSGWISSIDPRAVGNAALRVGAGRLTHNAPLDHAAGVVTCKRVGDRVSAGETLAELHHAAGDVAEAVDLLSSAFVVDDEPSSAPPLIHGIV